MVTDYRYKDGTDRLISLGTELFAYDDMGNSKTYRNMSCMWESQNKVSTLLEKGAQYLVGTIAKSPVNAIQYFVANVN